MPVNRIGDEGFEALWWALKDPNGPQHLDNLELSGLLYVSFWLFHANASGNAGITEKGLRPLTVNDLTHRKSFRISLNGTARTTFAM